MAINNQLYPDWKDVVDYFINILLGQLIKQAIRVVIIMSSYVT